jgi:hypothetical protein
MRHSHKRRNVLGFVREVERRQPNGRPGRVCGSRRANGKCGPVETVATLIMHRYIIQALPAQKQARLSTTARNAFGWNATYV